MVRLSRGAGVPLLRFCAYIIRSLCFLPARRARLPYCGACSSLTSSSSSRLFQTRRLHQRRGALFLITLLSKLDILGALSIEGRSTNLISPYTSSLRPLFSKGAEKAPARSERSKQTSGLATRAIPLRSTYEPPFEAF